MKAVLVLVLLLTGCTLVHVGINSDDEGATTVNPDGVKITINKGADHGA